MAKGKQRRLIKPPKMANAGAMKQALAAGKVDTVVLGRIQKHLLAREDGERDMTMLHPSEMAKPDWCPRQSYYRLSPEHDDEPKEEISYVLENIFDEGHFVHGKYQGRLWDLGILRGWFKCLYCAHRWHDTSPQVCPLCEAPRGCLEYKEVSLRSDDYFITGHADGDLALDDEETDPLLEVKGLPLDTPIPTPTGWSTMGALRVGDAVFGADGRPCTVTQKSNVKRIGTYVVRFDDGTEQVCDREHVWWTVSGRWPARESVLSVEEIAATLKLGGQSQHRVPLAAPLFLPEADLPVDPYVLGVWLGDGSVAGGSARVSKGRDLYDEVRKVSPVSEFWESGNYWVVHGLITPLKELGLAGVPSSDRWVPPEYLRASADQRLAILQGLMDTDGTVVQQRKQVSFTTTSERLAEAVHELAASLGWRPYKIKVRRSGFGKTVDSWDVRWSPLPHLVPFRRAYHIERMTLGRPTPHRVIVAVEPGPDVETACIAVDSPNRTYLCGRSFLPTHNTIGEGTVRHEYPQLLYNHSTTSVDGKPLVDLAGLWNDIKRPFPSHLRQAMLYLAITGRKRMVFIYECKWNQQTKEFVVKFRRDIAEPLLDAALDVKYGLESGRAPHRPNWAAEDADKCKGCFYRSTCYGIEQTENQDDDQERGAGAGDQGRGEAQGRPDRVDRAAPEAEVQGRRWHPSGPAADGAAAPVRVVRRRSHAVVRQPDPVE